MRHSFFISILNILQQKIKNLPDFITEKKIKSLILFGTFITYLRIAIVFGKIKIINPKKKIIVIALVDYIGDIVASEPAIRQIRKMHPKDYLMWIVRKEFAELVRYHPQLDKVISIYCLKVWININKFIRHLGVVYDLHIDGKWCEKGRVRLIKAKKSLISFENYYYYGNLLNIFSACAELPLTVDDAPKIFIPIKVKKSVQNLKLPKDYICIHTNSKDESRNWDNEKWNTLFVKIISTFNFCVVEIGKKNVIKINSGKYINLCAKTNLLETAEIISRAKLFIGIDSGPAHIANACGTYGIILLGKYGHFECYMPFSGNYSNQKNASIVYAPNGESAKMISVEQIYQKIFEYLQKK